MITELEIGPSIRRRESMEARGSSLASKPRSPKQGYQWPYKKVLCLLKFFEKTLRLFGDAPHPLKVVEQKS